MKRTSKRQAEIDTILAQLIKPGDWQCKYCSTENWDFYVTADKTECPNCHRPKESCTSKTYRESK